MHSSSISELQLFQILNIITKWSVKWAEHSAGITASPCCHSRIKLARAALVRFRVLLMERKKGQAASFQNMPYAIKPQNSIFKLLWVWTPHCCSHDTKNSTYFGQANTTSSADFLLPSLQTQAFPFRVQTCHSLRRVTFSETLHLSDFSPQDCPCIDTRRQQVARVRNHLPVEGKAVLEQTVWEDRVTGMLLRPGTQHWGRHYLQREKSW